MKMKSNRRLTREVMVGSVGVGGDNPIRIQSMTTTKTCDSLATAQQIKRLADAGCEIARLTVQGKKEALACEAIKNELLKSGYFIPIVADIHFYPPAAMIAIDFVDKIRINPGNFVDKRAQFQKKEYDAISYENEIEKIEGAFIPLIEKCKQLKKSLRIGTNHGSLSDRIMNRYGNSPKGMVESALEFARICRKQNFHDLIFSMKASNPIIMIEAYRQLVSEMNNLHWDYPLHLGVTEAGLGVDGRIKSAMGIGALLLEGIGDTIRISLTEDPWHEIDPCKRLISFVEKKNSMGVLQAAPQKRRCNDQNLTQVIVRAKPCELLDLNQKPDGVWLDEELSKTDEKQLLDAGIYPYTKSSKIIFFHPQKFPISETRQLIEELKNLPIDQPVFLCISYAGSYEDILIQASAEMGSILCDRLVEGICIDADLSIEERIKLSFNILQSARLRMTKTEYISCPGCGRTRFDLQGVTKKIQEKTSHLAGVKIAIMGCIVNGPREMADADFGFVGAQNGKIDLYLNQECVEKGIEIEDGPDRLVQLIVASGKWIAID